jgi:hypothetical protein
VRRSIIIALAAIAVVIVVLLARIFWPSRITAEASLGTQSYDVPGLEIQKLEPVW